MRYALFLFVLLLAQGCKQADDTAKQLFELVEGSGIAFSNDVTDQPDNNIFKYRNFYNGGGAAIGDINNDGLADVFFTANMGNNKLFLNKGGFAFDDISEQAGFGAKEQWSTGVVMVDINNDGWLDIFVCNAGHMQQEALRKNQLFINNHNLTFTEKAAEYGLDNNGYTTHASFFDYDMDGDLDCFMVNNSPLPVNTLNYANARGVRAENSPVADFLKGGGDHLYRNDKGRFTEVSEQAGIHGTLISFGLGVTVGDVNGDGWLDVYVSNDFFERDYLYINQRNGTFKDEIEQWMGHTSLASMGTDMADINNDGYPDIFTTDMLPDDDYRLKTTTSFDNIDVYRLKERSGFHHQFMQNSLQLNNGNGRFKEIAHMAGVEASDWSWGELMFDADNDGLTDIYVCNGIARDLTNQDFIDFFANDLVQRMVLTGQKDEINSIVDKMSSQPLLSKMYRNNGDLSFKDIGREWGFTTPSFSNGAAYGDLDNDGDLDLVINNVNRQAFVYRNHSRQKTNHHFIGFTLEGTGQNRYAIGTKINLYRKGKVFSRELVPARGFQSSMDYKQVIGTGDHAIIDSVQFIWPNLTSSMLKNVKADSVYAIKQSAIASQPYQPHEEKVDPLFLATDASFEKHQENDHVDFYAERNIPRMLSREGPRAATADVNGDGLTDVFICGANNQGGRLYMQQANGGFANKTQPTFQPFNAYEDVATVFFDADKDGDPDLFIGAGGNDRIATGGMLNHRLFMNDGKGNFKHAPDAFPAYGFNAGVAAPYDFDGDGDMDLFVGSRSTPFLYGVTPSSYLYVNDGAGRFSDQANKLSAQISKAGMVTGAVWANITGDAKKELVIVGDWMYPGVFAYDNGKFNEVTTNLNQLYGWWQTVEAADLDGDGKEDLVLGNMGENAYLQPDAGKPVKLWLNDFDGNGSREKILTKTLDGKDYPVFLKHDLEEQLPILKKQNLRHEAYAKKTFRELFKEEQLKQSEVKQYNFPGSIIAWNRTGTQFDVQKLPAEVQFSCINAIRCTDLNHDGKPDMVMGGNQFGFLPQFGRLDASLGSVLINEGGRRFRLLSDKQSGLSVTGQVRDIAVIGNGVKRRVLFLRNDDYPVLLKLNQHK